MFLAIHFRHCSFPFSQLGRVRNDNTISFSRSSALHPILEKEVLFILRLRAAADAAVRVLNMPRVDERRHEERREVVVIFYEGLHAGFSSFPSAHNEGTYELQINDTTR